MTTELWRVWAFGSLAELAFAVELLLAAITAGMGLMGVFLCLTGANGRLETNLIERECTSSGDDQRLRTQAGPGNGPVTVRIEPGYLRLFRRRLCVVTISKGLKDTSDVDREAWYAKEDG